MWAGMQSNLHMLGVFHASARVRLASTCHIHNQAAGDKLPMPEQQLARWAKHEMKAQKPCIHQEVVYTLYSSADAYHVPEAHIDSTAAIHWLVLLHLAAPLVHGTIRILLDEGLLLCKAISTKYSLQTLQGVLVITCLHPI